MDFHALFRFVWSDRPIGRGRIPTLRFTSLGMTIHGQGSDFRNDSFYFVILRRNPIWDSDVRIDRCRFCSSACCTAKTTEEEPEKSRTKFLNSLQESFCRFLWKKRRKTIRRAKNSGNRRRSRLKRYADKLAPALLDGACAAGSASRFFAMRSLRCASRQAIDSCALFHFARNDSSSAAVGFPRSVSLRSE